MRWSPVLAFALCAVAGCSSTSGSEAPTSSSSAATPSTPSARATAIFRGEVASQFNGTVATGDGRGCVKTSDVSGTLTFSCTAYVRDANNSLSSGQDVAGTVTGSANGGMSASVHKASASEIQDWFAKTGGRGCKTDSC